MTPDTGKKGGLAPARLPLMAALLATMMSASSSCAVVEFFDPAHTGFEDVEEAQMYRSKAIGSTTAPGGAITVMTWNIKFGGGRIDFFWDCYGDRTLMSEGETLSNMNAIAAKINEVNPDILLLQEVDIEAKRSAYVDQVQHLLDNTSLNYGAYASQWKADYIPSDGMGRMNSGNAILSRWPISKATRYALPQISEQSNVTRYFYLRRNYLQASISISGANGFEVFNIHTSAYSSDGTKKKQLDIFLQALKDAKAAGNNFVAGGDFNTIPGNSSKTSDFPDSVCKDPDYIADDYSAELTWLDGFYSNFSPALSLTDYLLAESTYFTHTVDGNGFWNRKLDYLFTNTAFEVGTTVTYQDTNTGLATMPLSDHAPMATQWSIP